MTVGLILEISSVIIVSKNVNDYMRGYCRHCAMSNMSDVQYTVCNTLVSLYAFCVRMMKALFLNEAELGNLHCRKAMAALWL
jgi:hypothetical protein